MWAADVATTCLKARLARGSVRGPLEEGGLAEETKSGTDRRGPFGSDSVKRVREPRANPLAWASARMHFEVKASKDGWTAEDVWYESGPLLKQERTRAVPGESGEKSDSDFLRGARGEMSSVGKQLKALPGSPRSDTNVRRRQRAGKANLEASGKTR
jgi:hypothetical protein